MDKKLVGMAVFGGLVGSLWNAHLNRSVPYLNLQGFVFGATWGVATECTIRLRGRIMQSDSDALRQSLSKVGALAIIFASGYAIRYGLRETLGWKIKEELPARITAAICFMPLRDPRLFKAMGP